MRNRALLFPIMAALAAPLCLHAQGMAPMTDRILSDPAFLPLQGQFYGESNYAYNQVNGERYDYVGDYLAHTRVVANNLTQYFSYGITDDISVNASLSGDVSGFNRVDNAAGDSRTSQSGFYDPSFGVTWRAIDQRRGAFNLDLFGHFAPDVFSNHSGTETQDASVARGGSEGDFGIALSQENRFFTIRADATARYLGASTAENEVNGNQVRTDSYWAPSLGLQTQVRFTPRLSANAGASYIFNGSPVVTAPSGLQRVDHVGDVQTVNVSLNYHLIPNRLVASVNYGHNFYGDSHATYSVDPALDTSDHRTEDTVGGTLRYVFK